VRTIDVHGACEQGAVPRTKASCVDTNVTDVAVKPLGTGPPGGAGIMGAPGVTDGPTVGVAAGVRAAAGGEDDPQPDSAKPISSMPARITKPAGARIT
jgi:hypothetical protein